MIKLKFNKNGKPNKNSLKAAKAKLKQSFETVKQDQIPKQLQGYYRQIENGKKRGEANKNKLRTSTGKFFSAAASLEFKKLVKSFAIEKKLSEEEILKDKQLFKILEQKVLTDTLTITKDSDLLIDFLKRENFRKLFLIDQNGNKKQVSIEQLVLEIKTTNKKILEKLEESKFGFWNRITYTPSGEFAEVNYINFDDNISPEDLNDIINEEMESENFAAYGSPPNKGKEEIENTDKDKTNVEKAENKKPNKQGTNKSGNKVSKRK
jgi:hypothetical protein